MLELNVKAKPFNEIEHLIGAHLFQLAYKASKAGSKVICDPPPVDSDTDILVMSVDTVAFKEVLEEEGWKQDGEYELDEAFTSWRKGDVNIILTGSFTWYNKFLKAVAVCKLLNIKDKQLRIAVHNIVMDVEKKGE